MGSVGGTPPSHAADVDSANVDAAKRCRQCAPTFKPSPSPFPFPFPCRMRPHTPAHPSTQLHTTEHQRTVLLSCTPKRPAPHPLTRRRRCGGVGATAASGGSRVRTAAAKQETDQASSSGPSAELRPSTRHFFASAGDKASLQGAPRLRVGRCISRSSASAIASSCAALSPTALTTKKS